ncbi:MAG: hypothetical protein P4L56_03600 [Candidatus Sulfopaludibacter sp.]|nr:hypothetical protein [Candidatus Sulfopaludibacter sp.]
MREALLIFRKDVAHRQGAVSAFLLLVIARMAIDILLPRHSGLAGAQMVLGLVFVVAAIGLMYDAVKQETIVGDGQYWLTRPFPWGSILAAKALFILLLILLPVFLTGTVAVAVNGVSPVIASPLLVILALAGAFVVTVASVTRTPVQFILCVVAYVVLSVLSTPVMEHLFGYETGMWGSAQTVRYAADTALYLAVTAAVIFLQYRRRATPVSRGVLGAGLLVLVIGLPGWHPAFALLEKLKGPGPSGSVQIAFDAARSPQVSPGGWSNVTTYDAVGVRIPIAIAGIPAGAHLMMERVRTTIDAPGGGHWDSGWSLVGGIVGRTELGAGQRLIDARNDYWLELNVDSSFYDRAKLQEAPVRVRSTAAFATLSAPRIDRMPIPSTAYRMGPGDLCSVSIPDGIQLVITCLSASGGDLTDATFALTDGKRAEGFGTRLGGLSAWTVFSTAITGLGLMEPTPSGQVRAFFTGPTMVEIAKRDTTGYFERSLTIDNIRLGPYEAGRSGPRSLVW